MPLHPREIDVQIRGFFIPKILPKLHNPLDILTICQYIRFMCRFSLLVPTHYITVIVLLKFTINRVPLFTQEEGITITDLSIVVKDGNTRPESA